MLAVRTRPGLRVNLGFKLALFLSQGLELEFFILLYSKSELFKTSILLEEQLVVIEIARLVLDDIYCFIRYQLRNRVKMWDDFGLSPA
jgi:hypothetical protein